MVGKFKIERRGKDFNAFFKESQKFWDNPVKMNDRIAVAMAKEAVLRIKEGISPRLKSRAGTPLMKTGTHIVNRMSFERGHRSKSVAFVPWEYARIHQFGATITPKKAKMLAFKVRGKSVFAKKVVIPARPFFKMDADLERTIEDIIHQTASVDIMNKTPRVRKVVRPKGRFAL